MVTKTDYLIQYLLNYPEPIIRWKMRRYVLGNNELSTEYQRAKNDLASSSIIQQLLSDQDIDGRIPYHPYDKWFGAHWILSILADLGYPEGDETLKPLINQCCDWLLSKEHAKYIQSINGRVRRCASQEGNCVYYSIALGLADDRTQELASRLMKWQWDDGGWNCDKKPEAFKSSFFESLIPLRGLAWYANKSGDAKVGQAISQAAEVFLRHHIFKRLSDARVLDRNFIILHYPCYWHYDILFGLKVMFEAGFLEDPRCNAALDLLERKQLSDGGFPAEARYYHVSEKKLSGHSRVDWGGISKKYMNPYVSVDALTVLKYSGRLA